MMRSRGVLVSVTSWSSVGAGAASVARCDPRRGGVRRVRAPRVHAAIRGTDLSSVLFPGPRGGAVRGRAAVEAHPGVGSTPGAAAGGRPAHHRTESGQRDLGELDAVA